MNSTLAMEFKSGILFSFPHHHFFTVPLHGEACLHDIRAAKPIAVASSYIDSFCEKRAQHCQKTCTAKVGFDHMQVSEQMTYQNN